MKLQLLTSLDIYIMAAELAKSLTGKPIKSIIYMSGDYYFTIGDIKLKFTVFRGSPFIKFYKNEIKGRNRLNIINGGIIESVHQVKMDRVIRLNITSLDRLGKRKAYSLFFEIFKNGNIVLTDGQSKIMFSHRKSYSSGDIYNPERHPGFNLLAHDTSKVLTEDNIEQIKLLRVFQHSNILDKPVSVEINGLIDSCREKPQPGLLYDKDKALIGYAVYGPPYIDCLTHESYHSLLEVITLYIDSLAGDKKNRFVDYKKLIKKAEKKLAAIESELTETENYKLYRLMGELILTDLHLIKKGQKEYQAQNHYTTSDSDKTILITLDPSITPDKNAGQYFSKAHKLEIAIPIIKKRLEKQLAEIERLRKLDSGEIEDSFPAKDAIKAGKQYQSKIPFKQFDLGNGWKAFAGKSAKSNDQLTFGFANKDDLWFHAWQTHGSHVILRSPQKGLIADYNLLVKAASLAAYLSKAKSSSKVPVIYTEVRYLRKVKKVPGKAIYSNEKELMVEPVSPNDIQRK